MNHPECLPQYRACAGTCGHSYALSAENFPTRKGEPNRYQWQPSYYRPRCHQCHREYLADLRDRTKANRYTKEAERQRRNRAAIKQSHGFARPPNEADRLARKAKAAAGLARAARGAEVRRTLRAGRPYDPATDPFKRMIRERQQQYMRKRLQANPVPREIHEAAPIEQGYLCRLEELRNRHRRQ